MALLTAASLAAWALDPIDDLKRANELVEQRQFALARAYLAPALVAPQLSDSQRAYAFALRAFSFDQQAMPVSALRDLNRALEFDPNNSDALAALGQMHFTGRGAAQNAAVGVAFFEEAAIQYQVTAMAYLGYALLLGEGIPPDLESARIWLSRAVEAGSGFAALHLAASYRVKHAGDAANTDLAEHFYRRGIELGQPDALVALSYMHAQGEFGAVDHARAVELLMQAVDAEVAVANVALAYAYLTGRGVDVDYALAKKHYEVAATEGLSDAFAGLGYLYESGLGVSQDLSQAQHFYLQAAELGDTHAQLQVAAILQSEAKDIAGAVYWLRQAAAADSTEGLNNLAWILSTSVDADLRDSVAAIKFATQAVVQAETPISLDTLAAAYAEAGQFEEAIATQQRALAMLTPESANIRPELQERLERYEMGKPWRE